MSGFSLHVAMNVLIWEYPAASGKTSVRATLKVSVVEFGKGNIISGPLEKAFGSLSSAELFSVVFKAGRFNESKRYCEGRDSWKYFPETSEGLISLQRFSWAFVWVDKNRVIRSRLIKPTRRVNFMMRVLGIRRVRMSKIRHSGKRIKSKLGPNTWLLWRL